VGSFDNWGRVDQSCHLPLRGYRVSNQEGSRDKYSLLCNSSGPRHTLKDWCRSYLALAFRG